MLCVGRDRSLQCSRSSLKSSTSSDIQFCREHSPSGSTDLTHSDHTPSSDLTHSDRTPSTDLTHSDHTPSSDLTHSDQTPPQPDGTDEVVARFDQTQSSDDDADRISEDFDDATSRKRYLVVLSSLDAGSSDETSVMLASFYRLSEGLDSCRTPGCYDLARDSGYCVGCQSKQTDDSSLPAIEFPSEDTASRGDVGKVPSSRLCEEVSDELSVDAAGTGSLSQSGEVTSVDDAWSPHLAESSSSSSRVAGAASSESETPQCRGPYCDNAGVIGLRGLCMPCYRTLLDANFSLRQRHSESSTDIDVDLD